MHTNQLSDLEVIYTVSRLNNEARFLLESSFNVIWIEGEISNFAAPHSGHWYFSLKDPSAQIRCAMFRANQRQLNFVPKDGFHVLVRARVSLYENRGEYQLIVEHLEERGEGKLRRAFQALKKKLELAGLFSEAHKKALPQFPKQIGVITSATGAALRDILIVLKRRLTHLPVIVYPTLVQGAEAAKEIVNMIQIANQRQECDVLILARGGGSLEDLWPFNEEIVAHAVFQSELPIITGIGHEVDFTIADFVADQRAPTPSAAAEMATLDQADLLSTLINFDQQILRLTKQKIKLISQEVGWMKKNLANQHPKKQLANKMQTLDLYERDLLQRQMQLQNNIKDKMKDLFTALQRVNPLQKIYVMINQTKIFEQQCVNASQTCLHRYQNRLANAAIKLETLSPLSTLQRGYAIATDAEQHILRDTTTLKIGDKITVRLLKDSLKCKVDEIFLAENLLPQEEDHFNS